PDVFVGVLRLAHVHHLDTRGGRGGQARDTVGAGAVIQRTCEDRGGGGDVALGLVGGDVVVAEDRHAAVGRDFCAAGQLDNLVDGRTAQVAQQGLVGPQRASVHGDVVHLAVLVHDTVHQFVQNLEAEGLAVGLRGQGLARG